MSWRKKHKKARKARYMAALPPIDYDELQKEIDEDIGLDDDLPFDLNKTRKVTIYKDHHLEYPDLYLAVHVVTDRPEEMCQFAELFTRAKCFRAESLKLADLVVFTGGDDVDPQLYGEVPHKRTHYNPQRDDDEMKIYLKCLEIGIPMFGVCRGAQFLHVMNGGKLYQDVDGHYGDHEIWDVLGKQNISNVSSVHHQMCKENSKKGMQLLATANKSRHRMLNPTDESKGANVDVEAYLYQDTMCLGVQGHPEYRGYNQYAVWCLKNIEKHIVSNKDCHYEGMRLRVTPEAIKSRTNQIIMA